MKPSNQSIPLEERRQAMEAQFTAAPCMGLATTLALQTIGDDWKAVVNERRRLANRPAIQRVDERAALAILGWTPELSDVIGPERAKQARQLNGILNAAQHDDVLQWRTGDGRRAEDLARGLAASVEVLTSAAAAKSPGPVQDLPPPSAPREPAETQPPQNPWADVGPGSRTLVDPVLAPSAPPRQRGRVRPEAERRTPWLVRRLLPIAVLSGVGGIAVAVVSGLVGLVDRRVAEGQLEELVPEHVLAGVVPDPLREDECHFSGPFHPEGGERVRLLCDNVDSAYYLAYASFRSERELAQFFEQRVRNRRTDAQVQQRIKGGGTGACRRPGHVTRYRLPGSAKAADGRVLCYGEQFPGGPTYNLEWTHRETRVYASLQAPVEDRALYRDVYHYWLKAGPTSETKLR